MWFWTGDVGSCTEIVTKLSGRKRGERQSQRAREAGYQKECANQNFKSEKRKQMPQSQKFNGN